MRSKMYLAILVLTIGMLIGADVGFAGMEMTAGSGVVCGDPTDGLGANSGGNCGDPGDGMDIPFLTGDPRDGLDLPFHLIYVESRGDLGLLSGDPDDGLDFESIFNKISVPGLTYEVRTVNLGLLGVITIIAYK